MTAPSARGWLPAAGLAALAVALHARAYAAFFVGDDFDYLRWSRMGPGGLVHMLRLVFWDEWEPVWYFTWYLDEQLWGLNPVGFHVHSTLWFALLVVALYALVCRLCPHQPALAVTAALLLATNPLQDEAVTYLAARGHVVCAALAVLSLWLWRGDRRILALLCAALAALSKETALLLPVWIAALEWALPRETPTRVRSATTAAAAFALACAATLALRAAVVGLQPAKLGGAVDLAGLARALATDLPGYALIGTLPLPFGLLDETAVRAFTWLGVVILLAATAALAPAAIATARSSASVGQRLFLFAAAICASSLFPVFWAGLPFRRRYLFVPSIGVALAAAVVLCWLRRRSPRAGTAAIVVLVVAGALGVIHRDGLYRLAGEVTRSVLETIRGTPIDEPLPAQARHRFVLVNLPARYGGDDLSGAYVFHHTDLLSASMVFGVPQADVDYALATVHADDHTVEVVGRGAEHIDVRISFRSRRAFETAMRHEMAEDFRGDSVRAQRLESDDAARTLTYRVQLLPELFRDRAFLYVYTDDGLLRILPEES